MNSAYKITGDQLANALNSLGVRFIMGGQSHGTMPYTPPARLLAALARSDEARLRLALIPLFLEHPEFAAHVRAAARQLDRLARLTLQCYYTAAFCLQQTLPSQSEPLPDLFSGELNLSLGDDPEENLRALAERHRELSGARVNWLGTYQHAAQTWRKGLEFRKA
ncbi:MAG: hypothetical protein FJ010_08660 [Chloroflexi bacterium]|nr:hypothetical protein [Chloroflexota bacterium]